MGFLNQPFPHDASLKSRLRTAVGFGVFIFLFLLVFRPFRLGNNGFISLMTSCAAFGIVTFVSIFVTTYLLELFFPGLFREEDWTTGKQILHVLFVMLIIGTVNFLLLPLLFNAALSWKNFGLTQLFTFVVGLLPVVIYTLYKQNTWLKQFQQEAAVLQMKLEEKKKVAFIVPGKTNGQQLITLFGDNQKEKISLPEQELVYLESASNYVKIFFQLNNKLSYSIIRTTMKRMEDSLTEQPVFFRCHRAYLVNLDKIEAVEGNAQGYKLKIMGTEERVPVSRNLNREFSDRLLSIRSTLTIYPAE